MPEEPSLEPLVQSVEVNCSQERAFEMWAFIPSSWWPLKEHSTFGPDSADVIIEPGVGGRIFERSTSGERREWGRVTGWRPPSRLSFTWHIYGSAEEATDVEISFKVLSVDTTLVTITHSGWERLKERAAELRRGNTRGWADLLAAFATAIDRQPDRR